MPIATVTDLGENLNDGSGGKKDVKLDKGKSKVVRLDSAEEEELIDDPEANDDEEMEQGQFLDYT